MLTKITIRRLLPAALLLLLTIPRPLQAGEFLLFYANDVHGETEACG